MMRTSLILAVAAIAMASSAAVAQDKPKAIVYYNPAWSADGSTIVFESNRETMFSALFAIRPDGTGLRRLTPGDAEDTQASWSPDGRRIAFSSARSGHLDLYLMNADGSGVKRVTNTPSGGYYQAAISPDGTRIAFQGRAENGRVDDHVYVIGADGTGMRQLTDTTANSMSPRWTVDGMWIVFDSHTVTKWYWKDVARGEYQAMAADQATYAIRSDGSGRRPFTERLRAKDASPDGRFVAVTKTVDKVAGLYVREVATGVERLLVSGAAVAP